VIFIEEYMIVISLLLTAIAAQQLQGIGNPRDALGALLGGKPPDSQNSQHTHRILSPALQEVSINGTLLFSNSQVIPEPSCFGPQRLIVEAGQ
jgi:hypothetical protein